MAVHTAIKCRQAARRRGSLLHWRPLNSTRMGIGRQEILRIFAKTDHIEYAMSHPMFRRRAPLPSVYVFKRHARRRAELKAEPQL